MAIVPWLPPRLIMDARTRRSCKRVKMTDRIVLAPAASNSPIVLSPASRAEATLPSFAATIICVNVVVWGAILYCWRFVDRLASFNIQLGGLGYRWLESGFRALVVDTFPRYNTLLECRHIRSQRCGTIWYVEVFASSTALISLYLAHPTCSVDIDHSRCS